MGQFRGGGQRLETTSPGPTPLPMAQGGHAQVLPENPRHVALVREPAPLGHPGDGEGGTAKHLRGLQQAPAPQELAHRAPGMSPECARQVLTARSNAGEDGREGTSRRGRPTVCTEWLLATPVVSMEWTKRTSSDHDSISPGGA